jgi:hypothetical protein
MADLSTDVEALLQVVSKDGLLDQPGEIADHMRRLWASYNTAISSTCIKPELRLLQVKNDRRRAERQEKDNIRKDSTPGSQLDDVSRRLYHVNKPAGADPSRVDMDLVRVSEGTVLLPFQFDNTSAIIGGRNIFEIVSQRHAEFQDHLKLQEERSAAMNALDS